MPRYMSVSMTEQQVREGIKFVTRRTGWLHVKVDDELTLVRKVMGLKKGEKVTPIRDVTVESVWREPLTRLLVCDAYAWQEVALEGFPGMNPREFVDRFFIKAQGLKPETEVTRIGWRYLDDEVL